MCAPRDRHDQYADANTQEVAISTIDPDSERTGSLPEPATPHTPPSEPSAPPGPALDDDLFGRNPEPITVAEGPAGFAQPAAEPPPLAEASFAPPPPAPLKTRSRGKTVTIVLLSVLLAAVIGLLAFFLLRLENAIQRIDQQERELEDQRELIEKKETFGAAAEALMQTVSTFEGIRTPSLVPLHRYESLINRGWDHRWDAAALDRDVTMVETATQELLDLQSAASLEASTNVSGTTNEAIIDSLGGGYITSVFEDITTLCTENAWACVFSDTPYVVHFDAAANSLPFMTDEIRTGVAYHEYAHVLQFTNTEETQVALTAFGGDDEIMADCFALTFLDGWKLDHTIFTSEYEYWEISVGYGHTCDATQAQAVRDWYASLGFQSQPISQ